MLVAVAEVEPLVNLLARVGMVEAVQEVWLRAPKQVAQREQ